MKIDHIAIWVSDLEKMKNFYEAYFQAKAGEKYVNVDKGFSSYFLSFEGKCRLEIMYQSARCELIVRGVINRSGLTHFSMSVGSKEQVDLLTEVLRSNGFSIVGEPRITGDGYYESVVLDPEGNAIEITE